jgi:hypothetical protein
LKTKTRRLAPKEKEQRMKNQSTLMNAMHRPGRFGPALAALLLLGIAASSLSAQVLPPSSLPYGFSYQEWLAKWGHFVFGQDTNHLALVGDPGICSGPASRVRFGLNWQFGPGTNYVTIPAGTPLFFPMVWYFADNTACPLSAFTSYTADQLAAFDEQGYSNVKEISFAIDGVAVDGLEDPSNSVYHVVSPPFSYTTAEYGNYVAVLEGEPCLPGGLTVYPAVLDGACLMLAPLSPGTHTLYGHLVIGPTTLEGFANITVTRDHDGDHDHDGDYGGHSR